MSSQLRSIMVKTASYYRTKEEAEKVIAQTYREHSKKPLVFARTDNLHEPWVIDYEKRDHSYAWHKVLEDHNYEIKTLISRPNVSLFTFEFEASTVNEAKSMAETLIPSNANKISFEIIRDRNGSIVVDDKSKTVAYDLATCRVPKGAKIENDQILRAGQTGTLSLQADTENQAKDMARKELPEGACISRVIPSQSASSGFFGIGRKQNEYDVDWFVPWRVSITYSSQTALIKVKFQPSAELLELLDRVRILLGPNMKDLSYAGETVEKFIHAGEIGIIALRDWLREAFAIRTNLGLLLNVALSVYQRTKNNQLKTLFETILGEGANLIAGKPKPPTWMPTLTPSIIGDGKYGWDNFVYKSAREQLIIENHSKVLSQVG